MGDGPVGPGVGGGDPVCTDVERRELDALRRRAYGPDADIFDDGAALARLTALEDRVRLGRAPREAPPTLTEPSPPVLDPGARSAVPAPERDPVARMVGSGGPRRARWHTGLVTGTAVTAMLLGAAAWTAGQAPGAADLPSTYAKSAAVANERRAAGYEASYDLYLDGLREEVLTLPGYEAVAGLMIRDQLTPYGILYGRTVGAGPTTDNRFCMIIADLPESSISCISIDEASAQPVSVLLPSWYSDAESDLFTGLGELITFTLLPGGSVVAVPADLAGGNGAAPQAGRPRDPAAPSPTASPPPGWQ